MAEPSKSPPEFETEAEERALWESHDSSDHVDWTQAQWARFANLKPSTKSICLRLSASLLDRIKIEAKRRDIPSRSRIKAWLAEDVARQRR